MKIETDKSQARDRVLHATRDQMLGQILNRYTQFIQAKDLEGLLELFSEDVVIFDLMTPFQYVGKDTLRERLVQWFDGYEGAINYTLDDLRVHSSETLGVAHALVKTSGVIVGDPKPSSMWVRMTITFENRDGDWLIVHEHTSEPFDMETGRAIQQR